MGCASASHNSDRRAFLRHALCKDALYKPITDDELRDLKGRLMQADIDNKRADTAYKEGLLRYEPWKVVAVAFGGGAAVMGAAIALLGVLFHAAVGR